MTTGNAMGIGGINVTDGNLQNARNVMARENNSGDDITGEGKFHTLPDAMVPDRTVESREDLRFPEDLASNPNRPQIRFTCFEKEDINAKGDKTYNLVRRSIYLPCPANIAFADNATLSTIDLGMFGAGLSDTLNRTEGTKGKAVAQLGGNFSKPGTIIQALLAGGIKGAKLAGAEGFVDKITFANRIIANPFQNTAYQGAGIRTFTFNFKMIAKNQKEAESIKQIHHRFRKYMYAGRMGKKADSAGFLTYPSVWEIAFLTGINEKGVNTNKFIPGIMACYLQNFNATFNTTAAAWHPDGAPLEVDVSMTYQEARALERNDIENLDNIVEFHADQVADDDDLMNSVGISNKGTSRAVGLAIGKYEPADTTEDGNTYGQSDEDLRTFGQKRQESRNSYQNRLRESKRIL